MTNGATTSPTEGVISEAFDLYKAHWQHLVTIALIVYLAIGVGSLILTAALGVVGAFFAGMLAIVGVFWLQGALIRAVEDIRDGQVDLTVSETFEGVKPDIGRIAGAGILAGLGIALGLLLLIVPGLYLLTIWAVLIPVIVLERAEIGAAFGRSRELVSGHGWNVFGVIILSWLVLLGVGIVIGLLTAPFGDEVGAFLSDVLGGAITGPFVALVLTIVYYRLRGVEEGRSRGFGTQPESSMPPPSDSPGSQPPPPPGTQSPGSQSPGSQSPGSQPPGSQPPGSQPPGSQPPGSQPPGSQPPGSQSPGSQPPGSQPPGSQPPSGPGAS